MLVFSVLGEPLEGQHLIIACLVLLLYFNDLP